jgi:hypothetical protein
MEEPHREVLSPVGAVETPKFLFRLSPVDHIAKYKKGTNGDFLGQRPSHVVYYLTHVASLEEDK